MRLWLFLLLALTLPARSWLGDAMAQRMVDPHLGGAVAMASVPHDAGARDAGQPAQAPHEECAGHAAAPVPSGVGPAHPAGGAADPAADCPTCAHCQACSAVAMAVAVPAQAVEPLPAAAPLFLPRLHASAERELAFKPPRG